MAVTTDIKDFVNRGLRVVGLELTTTRCDRIETVRLRALSARGHWLGPRFAEGLRLEAEKALNLLRKVCLPFRDQYTRWPREGQNGDKNFFVRNGWFQAVDSEMLYCLIRYHKPARIVEVGSGFSTRVMRLAIADGGLGTRLMSVDPSPRAEILEASDQHLARPVEELDATELADGLSAGDILFIDSSHTIASGSDVSFLFLEVIPRLRPGVLIHVHDIFLPFEYPMEWVIDYRWGWNEQYLVHALLCDNTRLEILWPAYYMWTVYGDKVRAVVPSQPGDVAPTSLWILKC